MFVICSLLLLSSCDKEPLMGSEEWEQERRNNFYDYKVKNRDGFDMQSIIARSLNDDTTFLFGIKNERMWIGMFELIKVMVSMNFIMLWQFLQIFIKRIGDL